VKKSPTAALPSQATPTSPSGDHRRAVTKASPGNNRTKRGAVKARQGKRLSREDREKAIVDAATAFFAEVGFSGQTRELAARAGITQSLLYRHFPTKDALIERVYRSVFLSKWNPEWEVWISDRETPLEARLIRFYVSYTKTIMSYEWIRLLLYSGLDGRNELSKKYLRFMHQRIWWRIIAEIRHHSKRPSLDVQPVTVIEVELVWAFIASIFHIGLRRFVFGITFPEDMDDIIADKVRGFLNGAPAAMSVTSAKDAIFEQLPNL
jgi:AcrR family transcriptional regulator